MPRAKSHRRQEIRQRRRQARRSLRFLVDDDLATPEEGWPQPSLSDTRAGSDPLYRVLARASDDREEQ